MAKRGGFPTNFRCLRVTRIAGPFSGYARGAIHRLEDSSCWRQVADRTEPVQAEGPLAWIYTDGNVCYLDVDGAHGVVEVAACVDPDQPTKPGLDASHLLGG
jgi:hypothetical protein